MAPAEVMDDTDSMLSRMYVGLTKQTLTESSTVDSAVNDDTQEQKLINEGMPDIIMATPLLFVLKSL